MANQESEGVSLGHQTVSQHADLIIGERYWFYTLPQVEGLKQEIHRVRTSQRAASGWTRALTCDSSRPQT